MTAFSGKKLPNLSSAPYYCSALPFGAPFFDFILIPGHPSPRYLERSRKSSLRNFSINR